MFETSVFGDVTLVDGVTQMVLRFQPAWSRDGRKLFHLDASGALVTVLIQTQPAFSTGNPTELFEAPFGRLGHGRYDVTEDGLKRLVPVN